MKDSYVIRLPYAENNFFDDSFVITEFDVNCLKENAKKEGRSLRTYVAYNLKKLARNKKGIKN